MGNIEKTEKEGKRIRLQLDFDSNGMERVESLKKKLDAKTNADVVRTAIRLLECFVEQVGDGGKVYFVDSSGTNQRQVQIII
jgi:hypothetical protein